MSSLRSSLFALLLRPLVGLMLLTTAAPAGERPAPRPLDPAIEARIASLLVAMTLEEKIGQMYMGSWSKDFDGSEIAEGSIGAMANCNDAETMTRLQKQALATRHGIPLIFARDAIHGYRTLFPVPLGLAASFDPEVWTSAATWTAREAHSQGMHLSLSPMVDVSRDTRWGRVVEGPGEDPYLASEFSAATVKGLAAGGIAATLKHFVGYGAVRAGRDYAEADFSIPTMHDVYLPPFRAGLDAGAPVVMAAFSAVAGVPVTASRRLLTDLLKTDWGFDGFVLSDWDAVRELFPHGLGADEDELVVKAVTAGLDMEMAGRLYPDRLPRLVRAGRVPMARIDDAVTRILRVKFRLGLFDGKAEAPAGEAAAVYATPEVREAAREAARRSIVLLKNDGDLLPLVHPPKRIAVIGGSANDPSDHMGAWGALGLQSDVVPFLAEMKRRLAPRGATVAFAKGCEGACERAKEADFRAAERAARDADLVIAVLGEPWYLTAESTSRTRIALPNHQQELLDRLAKTGRPVVLVTLAGRTMALGEAMAKSQAAFLAYSPGTMAGPALVDLILGDASPSARLPMSMPRAVGQLPFSYDALPTGRPKPGSKDDDLWSRYVDEEVTPRLPFGYGLSYGRFVYSDLRLSATRVRLDGRITASIEVANVGRQAAREIVQLYVHDPVASRSRPVRQLKGLAKVDLAPGERRRVAIEIAVADLGFHDDDGRRIVEPGRFDVYVGGSSDAEATAHFEAVAD